MRSKPTVAALTADVLQGVPCVRGVVRRIEEVLAPRHNGRFVVNVREGHPHERDGFLRVGDAADASDDRVKLESVALWCVSMLVIRLVEYLPNRNIQEVAGGVELAVCSSDAFRVSETDSMTNRESITILHSS